MIFKVDSGQGQLRFRKIFNPVRIPEGGPSPRAQSGMLSRDT
jgi:hypothetical protein